MIHHIDFKLLDRKFRRKGQTIAMSQHYALRLLSSDLSWQDRHTVIDYIFTHRSMFTPLPTDTDDPITNEIHRKLNGNNVSTDFFNRINTIHTN